MVQRVALLLVSHCRYVLKDEASSNLAPHKKQTRSAAETWLHGNKEPGRSNPCEHSDNIYTHGSTRGQSDMERTISSRPLNDNTVRCRITGTRCTQVVDSRHDNKSESTLMLGSTESVNYQQAPVFKSWNFETFLDECSPLRAISHSCKRDGMTSGIMNQVTCMAKHLGLKASNHTTAANAILKHYAPSQVLVHTLTFAHVPCSCGWEEHA